MATQWSHVLCSIYSNGKALWGESYSNLKHSTQKGYKELKLFGFISQAENPENKFRASHTVTTHHSWSILNINIKWVLTLFQICELTRWYVPKFIFLSVNLIQQQKTQKVYICCLDHSIFRCNVCKNSRGQSAQFWCDFTLILFMNQMKIVWPVWPP